MTRYSDSELVEEIANSLDNHESTVGVFIDLKRVFDTVDHDILIEKLYHYGIRDIANKWMCCYLVNIQSLFIVQKRAIRICLNTNYKCHKKPLF